MLPSVISNTSAPGTFNFSRLDGIYSTTPGRAGTRNNAPVHVAFRENEHVGTRDFQAFAAQWLAYAFPYRRFDAALADCAARLGADAGCYSFIVADFHHLLPAGFAGAPVCKVSGERRLDGLVDAEKFLHDFADGGSPFADQRPKPTHGFGRMGQPPDTAVVLVMGKE